MAESYTIVIAENGYIICRGDHDPDNGDVQIALVGELEEQLKIFRVKDRLAQSQKGVVCPPRPTAEPNYTALKDLLIFAKQTGLRYPTQPGEVMWVHGYKITYDDIVRGFIK